MLARAKGAPIQTSVKSRRWLAGIAIGVIPLLAAPASAVAETFCVNSPPGCTGTNQTFLQPALDAADANTEADLVVVAPGSYGIMTGLHYDAASGFPVEIQGSGSGGAPTGTTIIDPNAPFTNTLLTLSGEGSTVHGLRINIPEDSGANDTGLLLGEGTSASDVNVVGTEPAVFNVYGVVLDDGSAFRDGSIDFPVATSSHYFAVRPVNGGPDLASLERSDVSGQFGVIVDGEGPVLVRRSLMSASEGISLGQTATLALDDSVIDLGTLDNSSGVHLHDSGNSATGTIEMTADHLTIVGGGTGSRGAFLRASNPSFTDEGSPAHNQDAILNLTNSIIAGPANPYYLVADNDDDATVNADYVFAPGPSITDNDPINFGASPVGVTQINSSHPVSAADPGFVSATDFHLLGSSGLVDAGDPTATPTLSAAVPAFDLDGEPRVVDGDGDGIAHTDLGAYELPDTFDPTTKITKSPKKKTRMRKATFTFSSNEAGATFECKLDSKAFKPCSSPKTYKKLKRRKHTFRVRATDAFGNTDDSAAVKRWRVRKKRR